MDARFIFWPDTTPESVVVRFDVVIGLVGQRRDSAGQTRAETDDTVSNVARIHAGWPPGPPV